MSIPHRNAHVMLTRHDFISATLQNRVTFYLIVEELLQRSKQVKVVRTQSGL